jgi:hypothetical protein
MMQKRRTDDAQTRIWRKRGYAFLTTDGADSGACLPDSRELSLSSSFLIIGVLSER